MNRGALQKNWNAPCFCLYVQEKNESIVVYIVQYYTAEIV